MRSLALGGISDSRGLEHVAFVYDVASALK